MSWWYDVTIDVFDTEQDDLFWQYILKVSWLDGQGTSYSLNSGDLNKGKEPQWLTVNGKMVASAHICKPNGFTWRAHYDALNILCIPPPFLFTLVIISAHLYEASIRIKLNS